MFEIKGFVNIGPNIIGDKFFLIFMRNFMVSIGNSMVSRGIWDKYHK